MDLLTFIKKKKPQTAKNIKPRLKNVATKPLDTEMHPIKSQKAIDQKSTSTNQKTIQVGLKQKIDVKQLNQVLWKIQTVLEQEYQRLLDCKIQPQSDSLTLHILQTRFFRFEKVDEFKVLQRYQKVIQSCQLMLSKLMNNETVKYLIYVSDAQEFLLFFKSLFGKPYAFCNMESTRKVLQVVWDNELFPNNNVANCIENIRLWVYGIALPINPTTITLHRLVLSNPELITKALKFRSNQHLYIHINRSDALGLTPLLLVAKSIPETSTGKSIALQKLIKNGCDIFLCPLTLNKNAKVKIIKEKKQNKVKILIEKPFGQRIQANAIEQLFARKLFRNVVDIIYLDQIRRIKELRKDRHLEISLKKIPDCSFQIDWKTYKGILSFKALPKDVVSVYKREGCLRIDYHVDNVEKVSTQPNQHFSLLLKAQSTKNEFYLINHHNHKITDLFHEVNAKNIKSRYQNLLNVGNVENEQITSSKFQYNEDTGQMQSSVTFSYENVKPTTLQTITSVKQYQQAIINSDLINYSTLEKSQLKSVLMQNIINVEQTKKFKSKMVKSNLSFDVEWNKSYLNLQHLYSIMKIVEKNSLLLNKLSKIMSLFLSQKTLIEEHFNKLLPQKFKLNFEGDINIQGQIKNVNYGKVERDVFSLEYKAVKNNFQPESENERINSLQSTIIMDELYSLNVSKFIGKAEIHDELEQEEANQKFQQILMQEINNNDSKNESSSDEQEQER